MARERVFGIVLLAAGMVLAAGAAGDIGQLMSLPEVLEAIAGAMRDYGEALRPVAYLVAGSGALIAGVCCLGS